MNEGLKCVKLSQNDSLELAKGESKYFWCSEPAEVLESMWEEEYPR